MSNLQIRNMRPGEERKWCLFTNETLENVEDEIRLLEEAGKNGTLNYTTMYIAEFNKIWLGKAELLLWNENEAQLLAPIIPQKSEIPIVAKKLARYCIQIIKINNFKNLDCLITNETKHYKLLAIALEKAGFTLQSKRQLVRYNLENFHYDKQLERFDYKPIKEINKTIFLELLGKIYNDCLENEKIDLSEEDWDEYLNGTKHNSDMFLIVYHNNKPIGLILTELNNYDNNVGLIKFLGLIPEKRNKKYGNILYTKALSILKKHNAKEYLGSSDIDNEKMLKIFHYNNCQFLTKQYYYVCRF